MSEQKQKPREESPINEEKRTLLQRLFMSRGIRQSTLIPLLAIFTAFIVGGIIIAVSTPAVLQAWRDFFQAPWQAVKLTFETVLNAYLALLQGSFGSLKDIVAAIGGWIGSGESTPLLRSLRPLGESLMLSTPYIFAGLAVALGFRGGLFNIGAEGQLFIGGLAATFVGYSITGLPWIIHMPLALLAGMLAGALWGSIPGFLKARFGAHEVINTIMMNYIAFRFADYLLQGPMGRPDGMPITREIAKTAYLPTLLPSPVRVHLGLILALGAAYLVYWFLWKTPRGMEIRIVGANPNAARYAGITISRIIVLTMALSGALAGLAGTSQVLGVDHRMVRAFSSGYGFDSIALALLGNSHPLGVVLASLLFGFLKGGAARMQSVVGVPIEIISIIQGLIIVFVAAPEIIRGLYRMKSVGIKKKSVVAEGTGPS